MEKLTANLLDLSLETEEKYFSQLSDALAAAMDETIKYLRLEKSPRRLAPASRQTILRPMTMLWEAMATETADMLQDHLDTAFKSISSKAARQEVREQIVNEYIDNFGARNAAQVIRTTEKQVRDLVNGGLAKGQAIDTVFSSITNRIPGLADQRAAVISATEAHSISQFTSQQMAARSTLRLQKMWDSVNDERTRDFGEVGRISSYNHRIMNGVVTQLDAGFAVPTLIGGIERLRFPGDPKGSAGNVINCRCSQVYLRD